MTQDQLNVIRNLLNSNVTPEKIYETALEELKKVQQENEQEKKKEEARGALLKATKDYLEVLNIPVSSEEMAHSEKTLKEIEVVVKKAGANADKLIENLFNKHTVNTFDPDEILRTFLKEGRF